jgi:hypothetical protein
MPQQPSGEFNGGRYLSDLYTKDPLQANFLKSLINAVNTTAQNAAVSPTGSIEAPPPINSVQVAVGGEILHATATHVGTISKGTQYHWEVSAGDPAFTQPHVFDTGSSRTLITTLPTKDTSGNTVNYYLRAYPQYLGSQPATPTVHGGTNSPTAINMAGSTHLTLLPSTGSGTANTQGTQGGSGIGKIPVRVAPVRQGA